MGAMITMSKARWKLLSKILRIAGIVAFSTCVIMTEVLAQRASTSRPHNPDPEKRAFRLPPGGILCFLPANPRRHDLPVRVVLVGKFAPSLAGIGDAGVARR